MPSTSRLVQIAPGPTPTRMPATPVSISSLVAAVANRVADEHRYRASPWSDRSKRRPSRLCEMCRAVVTVDWTTKISQPASTAMRANFFVLAGVARYGDGDSLCLHLPNALGDEFRQNRLRVVVLQQRRNFGLRSRGESTGRSAWCHRNGCECLRGSKQQGRRGGLACRRIPG